MPLNTQCYLYRCCCIDISRASVHTDAGDTSASVLAGSSVDDQSSVAGHADSERDQTVSSPLHPSAAPQRSPTPDPPVTHQPRASSSHRPASAAPKVTTGVPFFSAKAAVQSQASAATKLLRQLLLTPKATWSMLHRCHQHQRVMHQLSLTPRKMLSMHHQLQLELPVVVSRAA